MQGQTHGCTAEESIGADSDILHSVQESGGDAVGKTALWEGVLRLCSMEFTNQYEDFSHITNKYQFQKDQKIYAKEKN